MAITFTVGYWIVFAFLGAGSRMKYTVSIFADRDCNRRVTYNIQALFDFAMRFTTLENVCKIFSDSGAIGR